MLQFFSLTFEFLFVGFLAFLHPTSHSCYYRVLFLCFGHMFWGYITPKIMHLSNLISFTFHQFPDSIFLIQFSNDLIKILDVIFFTFCTHFPQVLLLCFFSLFRCGFWKMVTPGQIVRISVFFSRLVMHCEVVSLQLFQPSEPDAFGLF